MNDSKATVQEALGSLKIERSRSLVSRRGRWGRFVFLAVAIVCILAAIGPAQRLLEDYLGPQVAVASVVLTDSFGSELSAAGYVVADRMSVLAFKGTGRLETLNVVEAQEVKRGQIVAEIDRRELEATLAQVRCAVAEARAEAERLKAVAKQAEAEAAASQAPLETSVAEVAEIDIKLADAHRRFERDKKLADKAAMSYSQTEDEQTEIHAAEAQIQTALKRRAEAQLKLAVSQAQVASARAAVTVAESHAASVAAQLGVLDAQVFDTRVFSPFDGVVIEKAAEVGEIVAPISIGGSMARGSIVTIAERKSFQAEVDVAEKYIARIRPGMRASIDIDAFTGKPLAGKVLRILPRANRSKATVQVRVTILDIDTHLEVLPDMGLRVKFLPDDAPAGAETSTAKSASVPASAVQSGEAGAFVWVVAGGKALKTPVVQGAARGESVEIKSGLSEGQKVVIKGADALRRDAQTVRVTE